MALCLHCGQEEEFELLEVWNSREFMIWTCCEASEQEARCSLAEDPEWARTALRRLGIDAICGETLRRVTDDGCGALILDWQFRLDRIPFRDARHFIDRHHEHLPGPTGWRFGQGLWSGPELLGVVTVGQPLARAYDRHQVVEVTRLCVRRDRPDALRWNACSALYGWAGREAQLRGFRRVITFTRDDEDGASLRGAGWTREARAGGRSWKWRGRPRTDYARPVPRWRWSRALKPLPSRKPASPPPHSAPCRLGEWPQEDQAA